MGMLSPQFFTLSGGFVFIECFSALSLLANLGWERGNGSRRQFVCQVFVILAILDLVKKTLLLSVWILDDWSRTPQ